MPRRKNKKKSKSAREGGRGQSGLRTQNTVQSFAKAVVKNPKYTIARSMCVGLPDEFHMSLVYAEALSFTSTTGSVSSQSYYGSDCYDPNATGVGAQPAWFDTMMTLYSFGMVEASRIVVTAKSTSATVPGVVVVAAVNNTGPAATMDLLTNPLAAEGVVTVDAPSYVFDMTVKWSELIGVPAKVMRASSDYWFQGGASPTYNWLWRIKYQSMDGASTSTCLMDTRLVYKCVFFRKQSSDNDFQRKYDLLVAAAQKAKEHEKAKVGGRLIAPEEKERSDTGPKFFPMVSDDWEVRSYSSDEEKAGRTTKKTSGPSVRSKSVK